jgi:hypothetical protein
VTSFAEIMPITPPPFIIKTSTSITHLKFWKKNGLAGLSQDELFEKLQNYKKLLDNGLILHANTTLIKGDLSFM